MKLRSDEAVGVGLRRAVRYVQGLLGLRSDDIILASYPRSGNTWVRFFFAQLVRRLERLDGEIDFSRMNALMPELGVSNLLRPWPYRSLPRVVKTHRVHAASLQKCRSILLIRDPRDVMLSYYHFEIGRRVPRFSGSLQDFLSHPRLGLRSWFRHYASWRGHASVVVRYEDLRHDDLRQFERMLSTMSVNISKALIVDAVRAARFDEMRATEEKYGNGTDRLRDDAKFTRSGKSGTWMQQVTPAEIEYYKCLCDKYDVRLYA